MKSIQGLAKRKGSVVYPRSGKKADDFSPLKAGDIAGVVHVGGGRAYIRFASYNGPVQDGTFIGQVVKCEGKIPGVAVGDDVVENMDFVESVVRGDNEAAARFR